MAFKYNEEALLQELRDYISGTYGQHYSAGNDRNFSSSVLNSAKHSLMSGLIISISNLFNSSSNPTFKEDSKADGYSNSYDSHYVSFNSIMLHDNNLNVITRTNLSRPVLKKLGDKYLVRIKIDY